MRWHGMPQRMFAASYTRMPDPSKRSTLSVWALAIAH
jgi:hypothetical protein